MTGWILKSDQLKHYPHFDRAISLKEATALACDPARVSRHAFYPFIRYIQKWNKYATPGVPHKKKERPIRYAARADAYIFSKYRFDLSEKYEELLASYGISESVLAYRRVKDASGAGKSNIEHSFDAFSAIRNLGNCYVLSLDISSYFESLDHEIIKRVWCRLLNVEKLPGDHFKVFRAITRYSVIDKEKLYEHLGFFGEKIDSSGNLTLGYLVHYKKIPRKLCSSQKFREKFVKDPVGKKLIKVNYKPYGIPQGSPISDLIANMYLMDFDRTMRDLAIKNGGYYFRYSDDILFVAQGVEADAKNMEKFIREEISNHGDKIIIKEEKSALYLFSKAVSTNQNIYRIDRPLDKKGLEYLGFRYDGKYCYIRDSTISNLYRKITRKARREAFAAARRYSNKSAEEIKELFNYELLIKEFGRVEDFPEVRHKYENWTFWTYARRAAERYQNLGKPILKQLKNHRDIIKYRFNSCLEIAVKKRDSAG